MANRVRPAAGWPLVIVVLLACVTPADAQQRDRRTRKRPAASRPTASAPVEPPADPTTIAGNHRNLSRIPASKATDRQRAECCGLGFVLALGVPDSRRAAEAIDAVGYQPLPLEGELPLQPPRPTPAEEIGKRAALRPAAALGDLPSAGFELLTRRQTAERFKAVAEWMLPDDFALLIHPPSPAVAGWVGRECVLVIRVRGTRATIVGGSLMEVLEDARG